MEQRERMPFNPHNRGLSVVYRENETNWCPGCNRKQWIIGRITAECAFCSTAIPMENTEDTVIHAPFIWKRGPKPRIRP